MSKTTRSMVLVSNDPLSVSRGSVEVLNKIKEAIAFYGLEDEISVSTVNDIGRNDAVPLVIVYPEAVAYGPVLPEDAQFLVEEHLYKGRVVESKLAPVRELSGQIAWLKNRKGTLPAEQRVVLSRIGLIDPESLEDYILHDGYTALGTALSSMSPAEVIAELDKSGLQGRGGAGFPVG